MRFWINRRKHGEPLTRLGGRRLVQQNDCRQIGGWPPTRLTQPLAELLDPRPNRDVGLFDADPAEYPLDLAKTPTAVVEQDRQLHELAIHPFTLGKTQSRPALSLVRIGSCSSPPVGGEPSQLFAKHTYLRRSLLSKDLFEDSGLSSVYPLEISRLTDP